MNKKVLAILNPVTQPTVGYGPYYPCQIIPVWFHRMHGSIMKRTNMWIVIINWSLIHRSDLKSKRYKKLFLFS